jgi:hypothetical protein
MRADVKEKFFPLPLRREMDVAICIQPDVRSGEADVLQKTKAVGGFYSTV